MAQLLLIKDANTPQKEVDDIIGFFEDNHKFSDYEKMVFNIQIIEGYTREAITVFAHNKLPEMKRIYRNKIANGWMLEAPEKKTAWKHDDKWHFLEEEPYKMYTIKNMTQQEKTILEDKDSANLDKLNALSHLECKIAMNPNNMVEIMELNK